MKGRISRLSARHFIAQPSALFHLFVNEPSSIKAAVRSFARTWTAELKGRIRVNVISPGTIDTAIFDGAPQKMKDEFVSIIPMGRIGKPREIATAALFLASDDSSFVTGIEHIRRRRHSAGRPFVDR